MPGPLIPIAAAGAARLAFRRALSKYTPSMLRTKYQPIRATKNYKKGQFVAAPQTKRSIVNQTRAKDAAAVVGGGAIVIGLKALFGGEQTKPITGTPTGMLDQKGETPAGVLVRRSSAKSRGVHALEGPEAAGPLVRQPKGTPTRMLDQKGETPERSSAKRTSASSASEKSEGPSAKRPKARPEAEFTDIEYNGIHYMGTNTRTGKRFQFIPSRLVQGKLKKEARRAWSEYQASQR